MSVINNPQGAVKLEEVMANEALAGIGTAIGQDALDVVKQLQRLGLEGNFSNAVFTDGRLQWDGSKLSWNIDTRTNKLIYRFLGTDSATLRTIDVVVTGSTVANGATAFKDVTLANGDLLYLEISKDNLMNSGGTLVIENAVTGGSVVSGKTMRKVNLTPTTGFPQIAIDLTNGGTTICIPVAFRYDWTGTTLQQDLIWCHGVRWQANTTVTLGSSTALSAGGSLLNYLELSLKSWDAEVGLDGWNQYVNAGASPTTGSGGSPSANWVFTSTSLNSEVLRGGSSYIIAKTSSANLQGQGVSVDYTIQRGYQSRRAIIKAVYRVISGTYNTGDIKLFVIADPNGTPAVLNVINPEVPTGEGELQAAFDPIVGVDTYRLCWHQASTTTNLFRLAFDDVRINPIFYVQADVLGSAASAGFIQQYGGTTDPTGYMICDGRSLSRTAYPELFANIGTAYGSVDVNSFNIPDLRGQFTRGLMNWQSQTFTSANVATNPTNTITLANHKINRSGFPVRFTSTGTLPAGLSANQTYYAIYVDGNTIKVSNTVSNTPVSITSGGTGTHTIVQWMDLGALNRSLGTVGGNSTGIGSSQSDAMQGHHHNYYAFNNHFSMGYNYADWEGNGFVENNDSRGTYNSKILDPSDDGTNGTPRTGLETRPANVSVCYVIKLYNDKKQTVLTNSRVEYVSNTNATNASSDLTAFSYAIAGSFIPNGATGTTYTRRVQFTSLITLSDRVILEVDGGSNGVIWSPASSRFPYLSVSGTQYGISVTPVPASNAVDVSFNSGGIDQSGASWSTLSTWKWRVIRTSNPNAVEASAGDDIGTVKMYAGDTPANGWLICDGRQLNRVSFQNLFAIVGTKYGAGDGSSTFNIPDLRGVFPRGNIGWDTQNFIPGNVNVGVSTITLTSHKINRSGFPVRFTNSGGGLPSALNNTTTYYAIYVDANTIKLATSRANALSGTAMGLGSAGTGTHTIIQYVDPDASSRLASTAGGDTGNTLGTYQDDQYKLHNHTFTIYGNTGGAVAPGGSNGTGGTSSPSTSLSGGNETRPVNLSVNFIIRAY